jgi:hypothetical protein
MIRICILIGFFIFSVSTNAALFGAKTYEECVSDGKIGRTNFEMQALSRKCRKDFPKLSNLAAKKLTEIQCEFSHKPNLDFYLSLNPKSKIAIFQTDKKGKITSISSSKVSAYFKDNEIGDFTISVDYVNGSAVFKVNDSVSYASCEEIR